MPVTAAQSTPVDHLVVFGWNDSAKPEHRAAAEAAFNELFEKDVEGIQENQYVVGTQINPEDPGKGWDLGIRVTFVNVAARDAYLNNPKHHEVVKRYIKNETTTYVAATVVFDMQHSLD